MRTDARDLVVVGFGGAGASAAITAHDLGASVVVLEKADTGGGSTEASGGNIRLIRDVEGAIRHLHALTGVNTPRAVVAAYVEGMTSLHGWLGELGAEFVPHDQYSDQALAVARPGSAFAGMADADALGSRVQVARPPGVTGGEALWRLLERNVRDRGIAVQCQAPVVKLRQDGPGGRVVGVEYRTEDGDHVVEARAGVVLACGGFNWGTDFHLDLFGAELPAYSPPHRNTGDGIRLAQEVGAQLWHMTAIAARFGMKVPGYEAAFPLHPPAQGLFLVDQFGRRYLDEAGVDKNVAGRCMLDRDPATGRLARLPSFMVFDEATRSSGPLMMRATGHNRRYEWSEDNGVEIERGWIHRAGSIPELADAIGVPRHELERTAERYNAACRSGEDDFGRPRALMEPVSRPPFYAVAVWPGLLNTQGGPRRDEAARVLDARGRPIPGLYSAGELGSMWGPVYPGAGNLSEALVTGRISARSALSLQAAGPAAASPL